MQMPSINRSKTKTPMPSQDPKERSRNFNEVALGYAKKTPSMKPCAV